MIEHKAFDVSLYARDQADIKFDQLTFDLSSYALEASSEHPISQRIDAFMLVLEEDARITSPLADGSGRDARTMFNTSTELFSKESKAGLSLLDAFVDQPIGAIGIWISPPGGELNYPEGRLEVTVSRKFGYTRVLEWYGIPYPLTSEECLQNAWRIGEFSQNSPPLLDPEDLRGEAMICFKPDQYHSVWEFLKEVISFPEAWDAIESGKVWEEKEKALAHAHSEVSEIKKSIEEAKTDEDFIRVGAILEQRMAKVGYRITEGACGISNQALLSKGKRLGAQYKNKEGQTVLCCKCPFCNHLVEAIIANGMILCPHCHESRPWFPIFSNN